jgi:hypothetical protein
MVEAVREQFGAHGHWLRQVWREGDVAVYERSLSKGEPGYALGW